MRALNSRLSLEAFDSCCSASTWSTKSGELASPFMDSRRIFEEGCGARSGEACTFSQNVCGGVFQAIQGLPVYLGFVHIVGGNPRIVQPIHGLAMQSSDPRFAQGNLQIARIRTLHTTYSCILLSSKSLNTSSPSIGWCISCKSLYPYYLQK